MYKHLLLAMILSASLHTLPANATPIFKANLETDFQFPLYATFVDLFASQKWGNGYNVITNSMQSTVYVPAAKNFLPSTLPNIIYQLSGVTMGARYAFSSQSVVSAYDDSEMFFDRETHGVFELTFQAVSPGLPGYFNSPSIHHWQLDLDSSYWFNHGGQQYETISDYSTRTGQIAVVGYDPEFASFPTNYIFTNTYPLPYAPDSPEALQVDLTTTVKLEMFYEAQDDLWNLARLNALNMHGTLYTTYYYDLIELPAPSPVPEPASITLLSMGIACFAGVRTLRKRDGL